jgi:hypothetical protein
MLDYYRATGLEVVASWVGIGFLLGVCACLAVIGFGMYLESVDRAAADAARTMRAAAAREHRRDLSGGGASERGTVQANSDDSG